MIAERHQLTVFQKRDAIGVAHRAQAMGREDHRTFSLALLQGSKDVCFRAHVHSGERIVQKQ